MKTENNLKWRSILGLAILYVAIWFNWQWVWGILFLLWVIPDILSGVTYFMEPVEKVKNPIVYWLIIGSWLLMCAYSVASLFYPELNNY